jgi:glutaredoxin-related protein
VYISVTGCLHSLVYLHQQVFFVNQVLSTPQCILHWGVDYEYSELMNIGKNLKSFLGVSNGTRRSH